MVCAEDTKLVGVQSRLVFKLFTIQRDTGYMEKGLSAVQVQMKMKLGVQLSESERVAAIGHSCKNTLRKQI